MSVRVWYGVLGAPLAWAVQLVVGFWIAQTACDRGGVEVDGWTLAVTLTVISPAL